MTVNKVPQAAATTNTQMDDNNLNPTRVATASSGRNRKIVHITLVLEGVSVSGDDIYDMLDAQFATVAGEKTTNSRDTYIFNIGPA